MLAHCRLNEQTCPTCSSLECNQCAGILPFQAINVLHVILAGSLPGSLISLWLLNGHFLFQISLKVYTIYDFNLFQQSLRSKFWVMIANISNHWEVSSLEVGLVPLFCVPSEAFLVIRPSPSWCFKRHGLFTRASLERLKAYKATVLYFL